MTYLEQYVQRIKERGNVELAQSIQKTSNEISCKYIENFNFMEHKIGLLVGNVQSGKTGQMFGVICAAADNDFINFVLLTTNSIRLQQQTLNRVKKDLPEFCICDESDYLKFRENNGCKPVIIVLKKDTNVLKTWRKNLGSEQRLLQGNPLFFIDDEADAASLNTKINQNSVSTINRILIDLKQISMASIYLEVTGTPQANLLQAKQEGWKPSFVYYFEPGKGYIGGNFFFQDSAETNKHIILTDEDEGNSVISDDEFPENNLKNAIIVHLLSSAQLFSKGEHVCNCLVHPSSKIKDHQKFANKIGEYLNDVQVMLEEKEYGLFDSMYNNLTETEPELLDKAILYRKVQQILSEERRPIIVINSNANFEESSNFEDGMNFIIGGNSLGRGLTFPKLQTVYYCRLAKNPQADTMWQHARMFGYDRYAKLLRVFMPPKLFHLFQEINEGNNCIIQQIKNDPTADSIQIVYPKDLKPTRGNVLNKRKLFNFLGGVNYFPFNPSNKNTLEIDEILKGFKENIPYYLINLKIVERILEKLDSDTSDWNVELYKKFVLSEIASGQSTQGVLIVRRNRNIGRGTGTLLSPTDRKLGDSIHDKVVLTMYKITGEKGWNGEKLWIPNIKFPDGLVYYNIE